MKEVLQQIKNASPTNSVLADMRDIVKEQTDNFTNADNLSDTKFDMTQTLDERGISKDDYIAKFGSLKRSEIDAVKNLAKLLGGSKSTSNDDEEKAKRIRIAKAKAKALLLLQEQAKMMN